MTLTQVDLDEIEKLMDQKLEEKLKHLPTRDEFLSKMDAVIKELETIREEQKLVSYRVSDHEDRLSTLEQTRTTGQHATI